MSAAYRPLMMSDVRRMRELHSQNVSQRRIAEMLGVNQSTVEHYTGRHEMYGRCLLYTSDAADE